MASITPYKDSNWRVVVRRAGFATRSRIFPTKKAAERWALEIEAEMAGRRYKDPVEFKLDTVADLFLKFRDQVSPKKKGRRWEQVRINALVRDAEFTKRRIPELSARDLREWRDARLQEVSAPSVNREMNLISGIFTYAMKELDYPWKVNPMHEVGRPAGGAGRPRRRRWSDAEIQAVLKAGKFDPDRAPRVGMEYVPWALLLIIETAMRPKEFCTAKVHDFVPHEHCLRLSDSKNGDSRDVPLSSRALTLLAKLTEGKRPTEKIFPITSDTLSAYFVRVRRDAGLENANLRLYDGKHEGISRMAPKFRDALELSKVTGHRDIKSLSVYYNPTASELARKLG